MNKRTERLLKRKAKQEARARARANHERLLDRVENAFRQPRGGFPFINVDYGALEARIVAKMVNFVDYPHYGKVDVEGVRAQFKKLYPDMFAYGDAWRSPPSCPPRAQYPLPSPVVLSQLCGEQLPCVKEVRDEQKEK